MKRLRFAIVLSILMYTACAQPQVGPNPYISDIPFDSTYSTIHIHVALCDNKYQGIVPVPVKIGNGQDADNNLYWGCGYGIRTFFRNSTDWKQIKRIKKINNIVRERIVFKHKNQPYYLVADAYDGKEIKQCTIDLLMSSAGMLKDTIMVDDKTLGIYGNSKLLAYIGHDGLMDFRLDKVYSNVDGLQRKVIILACMSKQFFTPYIKQAGAEPLVWTTGLMCPEAYTIHDAINTYIAGGNNNAVRESAAKAYAKYQKCSEKAARNLLVTGF